MIDPRNQVITKDELNYTLYYYKKQYFGRIVNLYIGL